MRRCVLRAVACAFLLSSIAAPTLAHAALGSATPGPGDRVTGSPAELVARFSQNLDPSRTSLEVRDPSGARVARGGELGDGPREFRLELPELAPGVYEVRWTTYSTEDNEIARDTYTFELLAAPSPSVTPTATALPSPPATASPPAQARATAPPRSPSASAAAGSETNAMSGLDAAVMIPIVVALVLVGAFGLWALRRQRA